MDGPCGYASRSSDRAPHPAEPAVVGTTPAEDRCEDWYDLPPADARALIAGEMEAWASELDWDVRQAWSSMEPARVARRLSGWLVRGSDGRIRGWTCHLVHRCVQQVAVLLSESYSVTRVLTSAMMRSAATAGIRQCVVSVRGVPPGLEAELAGRGFRVEPYLYLSRYLPAADAHDPPGRPWQSSDRSALAHLLRAAYADSSGVRAFAPGGTMPEWHDYVRTLVDTEGCGRLLPSISRVVPGADGWLTGAIMVSVIGPATAHIVQVAVHPRARGTGLGRRLLASAMAACAREGFGRVTLLVASSNHPALRLYQHSGFQERSRFVVGAAG